MIVGGVVDNAGLQLDQDGLKLSKHFDVPLFVGQPRRQGSECQIVGPK